MWGGVEGGEWGGGGGGGGELDYFLIDGEEVITFYIE